MAQPPSPGAQTAEEVFDRFLAGRKAGEEGDLEALCREHPDWAERLRSLHRQWEAGQAGRQPVVKGPQVKGLSPGRPGSGHDVAVSLDPGLAGGEAHASRTLLAKIETHAPKQFPYKLEGEIARGGMGAIIKAWDEDLRRDLAMKVILETVPQADAEKTPASGRRGSSSIPDKALSRFLEEAQVTGQLEHPSIVPVHDLGVDPDGQVYFTMPLIKGRNLRDIFKLVAEKREGWNPARAMGIILKACEAMAYAHSKGVIHRDLKPENIMVGRFGETYVMDWGLAKIQGQKDHVDLRISTKDTNETTSFVQSVRAEESDTGFGDGLHTVDGDVVGTPAYMSPEQAHGRLSEMGPHSDVYSVGAILYHLLAGHPPYCPKGGGMTAMKIWKAVKERGPRPLDKVDAKLPVELVAICEKAMARDIRERYPDMGKMAEDVRAYLENRVVRAHQTGALAEFRKWVVRNKGMAAAIGVALVAAVGGLAGISVVQAQANQALLSANVQIQTEKEAADAARLAAEEARKDADAARLRAEDARLKAEEALKAEEVARAEADEQRRAAEAERDKKDQALRRIIGLRLISQGKAEVQSNPALAWLLVMEAMRGVPGRLATNALFDAIQACHEAGLLIGHQGVVRDIAFAADGATLATAGDDGTARVWDLGTKRSLAVLQGHSGPVRSVAFSPDGARIVTASDDGTARIWDAASGSQLLLLEGHEAAVLSAQFDRRGRRVLTAGADHTARVWDAATGAVLHRISKSDPILYAAFPDSGDIVALTHSTATSIWKIDTDEQVNILYNVVSRGVFAPDDQTYLTWPEGEVQFWNCRGDRSVVGDLLLNKRLQTAHLSAVRHDDKVLGVSYSASGKRLITASRDKTAVVWALGTGENDPTRRIATLLGHDGAVICAALDPDGAIAVTASLDGTVRIWDVDQPKLQVSFCAGPVPPTASWFSPDGMRMLDVREEEGRPIYYIREVDSGRRVSVLADVPRPLESAAFSPDGRFIATTEAADRDIMIRAADSGRTLGFLQGRDQRVRHAGFSPDGSRIYTTAEDGALRIWDAATGRQLLAIRDRQGEMLEAAYSPDGRWLAASTADNKVRIWDAVTGKEIVYLQEKTWIPQTGGQDRPLFSPDGRLLATRSHKNIRIWSAGDWKEVALLEGHTNEILAFAFNGDGSRLVTASLDETARIWDTATGRSLAVLAEHGGFVTGVAFSPDGGKVVTACLDNDARVWNASTGALLGNFSRHEAGLNSVQFHADGRTLITGGSDRTARIWDIGTMDETVVLRGHRLRVRSAALSPDGLRAATACDDGLVRIWDARTGKMLFELAGHEQVVDHVEFSSDGRRVLSTGFSARIWDAATGEEVAPLVGIARDGLSAPVFSPRGGHLLSVSAWRRKKLEGGEFQREGPWVIRVWSPETRQVEVVLEGRARPAAPPVWSSDGTRILVRYEQEIGLFDAATGRRLRTMAAGGDAAFVSAVMSPGGRTIVTSQSGDPGVTVWDAAAGRVEQRLSGHTGAVLGAVFRPDGARLATFSEDHSVRLWDTETWSLERVLSHEEVVIQVAFSPDSARMVTVTDNQLVRMWDSATGAELADIEGWRHVFFSPDGRFLATAPREVGGILPEDWAGRLWPVDPLAYAQRNKPRDLFPEERERFEIPE